MIPDKVATAFASWQRRLVQVRESREETDAQEELARIIDAGAGHLYEYLLENLLMDRSNTYGVQMLHRQLTAGEANDPPKELEIEIANKFSDLHPAQAIRPVYWTVAHVQWMRQGRLLGDDWVRSLKGKNNDATARNVCRRLGGLHHIRGKVSVLSNCPISRAWWRVRIARRAAENSEDRLAAEDAYSVLQRNTSWAELVGGCVQSVAVINNPRALAAICCHLHSKFDPGQNPGARYVTKLTLALARHSNIISFAETPFEKLLGICDEVAEEF